MNIPIESNGAQKKFVLDTIECSAQLLATAHARKCHTIRLSPSSVFSAPINEETILNFSLQNSLSALFPVFIMSQLETNKLFETSLDVLEKQHVPDPTLIQAHCTLYSTAPPIYSASL
jgi:hypothetical protein